MEEHKYLIFSLVPMWEKLIKKFHCILCISSSTHYTLKTTIFFKEDLELYLFKCKMISYIIDIQKTSQCLSVS